MGKLADIEYLISTSNMVSMVFHNGRLRFTTDVLDFVQKQLQSEWTNQNQHQKRVEEAEGLFHGEEGNFDRKSINGLLMCCRLVSPLGHFVLEGTEGLLHAVLISTQPHVQFINAIGNRQQNPEHPKRQKSHCDASLSGVCEAFE